MPVLASVPPIAAPVPVAFTGRNGAFTRLVIRGAALELVTFGFYRFWLTTDIRRHLWSSTEIDGDALEYTGRAKELLFGFLIAMAVLGPVFLANFLVGLEFERLKAFTSLPLYLLLLAFGQFAVYRARRYRLTRTIWRGVRFWMTGSGWSYAWRSMAWGLLLVPSLGLAYPWRMAALERFKVGHTLYGDLNGRFIGTGSDLFKQVWWIWLIGVTPVGMMAAGGIMAAIAGETKGASQVPLAVAGGILMLIGSLSMVGLPFLHAVRRAREWNWWANGLRFGDVRVNCSLRPVVLIGIYWAMIGWGVLVFIVYSMLAGGLAAIVYVVVHPGPLKVAPGGQLPVWAIVLYAVSYLILLLVMGALARIYILQRIWRRVAESCAVVNIESAANVTGGGDLVSAFGEGLADGLDFGL